MSARKEPEMPATSLRCRSCATEYALEDIGTCTACFGPLDPVYDWDELARKWRRRRPASSAWTRSPARPQGTSPTRSRRAPPRKASRLPSSAPPTSSPRSSSPLPFTVPPSMRSVAPTTTAAGSRSSSPSSSPGALRRAVDEGELGSDDRVVLVVTGDGLKTPALVWARLDPVGIDADVDAVLERHGVLT